MLKKHSKESPKAKSYMKFSCVQVMSIQPLNIIFTIRKSCEGTNKLPQNLAKLIKALAKKINLPLEKCVLFHLEMKSLLPTLQKSNVSLKSFI